jgi:hypothetical protein
MPIYFNYPSICKAGTEFIRNINKIKITREDKYFWELAFLAQSRGVFLNLISKMFRICSSIYVSSAKDLFKLKNS